MILERPTMASFAAYLAAPLAAYLAARLAVCLAADPAAYLRVLICFSHKPGPSQYDNILKHRLT